MPTYAYRCADCGHAFDIQQSFSDDALSVCPECGGTLRKVFSSVGVVFKGSGFYRNDSRSGSKGTSTPVKEPSGAKEAAGGSGATAASTSGSDASSSSPAPSSTSAGTSTSGTSSPGATSSGSGSAKAASA